MLFVTGTIFAQISIPKQYESARVALESRHSLSVGVGFSMRLPVTFLILLIGTLTSASAQDYAITHGNVWNGIKFVERTLYVSDGVFVRQTSAVIDSTIDASGMYIIPAFGDFHTHVFDSEFAVQVDSSFRSKGIFFSQDLGNDPEGREMYESYLNQPETVDVTYANGILTSDYGHPIQGYERMALFGNSWPRNQAQRDSLRESRLMENRLYYIIDEKIIDEKEDIEPKLEALAATNPDVLKLVLWDSQEYLEDSTDSYTVNNKGLDPHLLPQIIDEANELELRPIAHVETEYDLIVGIREGIRSFAHVPYYGYGINGEISEQYPTLSEETKQVIRETDGLIVNPTLLRTSQNLRYLPEDRQPTEAELSTLKEFHARLLTDLKENGATIVAGADSPGIDAIDEILYYKQLGVFSDDELLNILIETAAHIFPERQIGSFDEGFEANFLILSRNPSQNIKHIQTIETAFKNGSPLSIN